MRTLLLFSALLCAWIFPVVHAQTPGVMGHLAYPHGAEAIRLGGSYAGVGRGLAAMHFNGAALAFQPDVQIMFTSGRSIDWLYSPMQDAYDAAGSVHVPAWETTFGIGYTNDVREIERRDEGNNVLGVFDVTEHRLSIQAARKVTAWLAIGLAAHQYTSAIDIPGFRESGSASVDFWDVSLSAHGRNAAQFLGRPQDEIRYGITLDNALGTEIAYIDEAQKDPIFQVLRAGIGYFWNPDFGKILHANALSVLITTKGDLQGTDYDFRTYAELGAGLEVRLLEVLMLSAGTQSRSWRGDGDVETPGYPVLRYGAGLDLPLERIFNTDTPISLRIDYARSSWNSDLKDQIGWDADNRTLQDNALSIQCSARLL